MKEFAVKIDDNLPNGIIGIPTEIAESFTIPDEVPYDLVLHGRTLSIGPVIGFVAFNHQNEVKPLRLERLNSRFAYYSKIRGLIFVCAAKGINVDERKIQGFYYNPNGKNESTRWVSGTFPYPDVVYRRHPIDKSRYSDLISQMEGRVINSYFFCKGELAEYALKNTDLAKFLPYTENLSGMEQLERMLNEYKSVYLKPRNAAGGRGILHVTKDEDEAVIITDRNRERTLYSNKEVLKEFIDNLIDKKYLIQQSVSISRSNQNMDFRIYAQKNGLKKWVCQGMIGRLSKKDSIITNLKYVDKLLTGENAIKFLFNMNDEDVQKMRDKIYKVCTQVCEILDETVGNYGDVAIDCIIDSNYNIWILEINNLYGYDSLIKMRKHNLVKILKTTPFQYAKALAGF